MFDEEHNIAVTVNSDDNIIVTMNVSFTPCVYQSGNPMYTVNINNIGVYLH